jgi:hypothetical protein
MFNQKYKENSVKIITVDDTLNVKKSKILVRPEFPEYE